MASQLPPLSPHPTPREERKPTMETDVQDAIGRIKQRVAEIDVHTERYPSWLGGTTWRHASDLRLVLDLLAGIGGGEGNQEDSSSISQSAPALHGADSHAEPYGPISKLIAERDEVAAQLSSVQEEYALCRKLLLDKTHLIPALKNAESWFRDYERQHRAKDMPDGDLKANINKERADFCRSAIAKATGGEG